jgi:hypothetical protein
MNWDALSGTELVEKLKQRELLLARLQELMALRNAQLAQTERILIARLASHQITFLNPISRKSLTNFMSLMSATLHVDCKLARRCLFILRSRQRHLEGECEALRNAIANREVASFEAQA